MNIYIDSLIKVYIHPFCGLSIFCRCKMLWIYCTSKEGLAVWRITFEELGKQKFNIGVVNWAFSLYNMGSSKKRIYVLLLNDCKVPYSECRWQNDIAHSMQFDFVICGGICRLSKKTYMGMVHLNHSVKG